MMNAANRHHHLEGATSCQSILLVRKTHTCLTPKVGQKQHGWWILIVWCQEVWEVCSLTTWMDLASIHTILDIACGPGEWVCNVAFEHAEIDVTGIDLSRSSIQYARARAQVQRLDNVSFRTMDATKSLDFPDGSFDFVNARFLVGFMSPTDWPRLLQECMRIMR